MEQIEPEFVVISDSEPEDSLNNRRKPDEQDPLEGRRTLRKKKKVNKKKNDANFPLIILLIHFID